VLIVEDEVLVRIDTREVEAADFEVVEAGNADEAIAIPRRARRYSSHLYRRPYAGFDGRAGSSRTSSENRWPPVKIIATSGRRITEGDSAKVVVFSTSPTRRRDHHDIA
jgi:hypothetical protein